MKELNILILGETGVGKSTWINGIVNYLSYETLEEAVKGDLKSVIGSSFTVYDENYEQTTVTTGSDDNEDFTAGQSATQFPKSYTFPMGDTNVRLIDTPGIGDVRGIAQDKINFELILNHLSYITELHAVCILLKPNNAKLSVTFQFCIKELLTHLHRDFSKNIVFCSTNARSTFYMPGETLPALKCLLKENKNVDIPLSKHTIYCMDNESFRFLAAVKHGIRFGDKNRASFTDSWNKSVEETKRLFSHIYSLPPHTTQDTLSLNNARRLITELTKPLADMSQNIQVNIAMLNNKKVEFETIDKNRKDLSERLRIPTTKLRAQSLGLPVIVCGASKCIDIIKESNGDESVSYKQICRNSSYFGLMLHRLLSHLFKLKSCSSCYKCGCDWDKHMQRTYKTIKTNEMVEDQAVKNLLSQAEGSLKAIETAIEKLEVKKKVLDDEQIVISQVSAKFAAFLHQSAITPYNDVMSDYLELLIEVENKKVGIGNDRSVLQGLKSFKTRYEENVKTIKESINSSPCKTDEITPAVIDELVKKLYELEETGPQ